jgi:hypothetical protein
MREYRYTLVVEIQSTDAGHRLAQDRLHRWLEHFGHTSSGHGFEFVSVGVQTAKRLSKAPKKKVA